MCVKLLYSLMSVPDQVMDAEVCTDFVEDGATWRVKWAMDSHTPRTRRMPILTAEAWNNAGTP